jgi:DNA-binding response OmpR family regulator
MNLVERQILVLDADSTERTSIQQVLAREGFEVAAVADAPSALRQLETKAFALVVAEIRLPGPLDGITTLRLARAKRPGLKCLFTSAIVPARLWGDDELDDFIAKPLDRRELLGCVFELLARGNHPEAAMPQDLEHSSHHKGDSGASAL